MTAESDKIPTGSIFNVPNQITMARFILAIVVIAGDFEFVIDGEAIDLQRHVVVVATM